MDNLAKLDKTLLDEKGLDVAVLSDESNILYATGIRSPSGTLLITRECGPLMVVPLLDYDRTMAEVPRNVEVYIAYRGGEEAIEPDVPKGRLIKRGLWEATGELVKKCGGKRVGADLSHMRYDVAEYFLKKIDVLNISQEIFHIRMIKSDKEINIIENSIHIAEQAFVSLLEYIQEGVREDETAGKLFHEMLRLGAWYEAFPSIVAFYSNTAYPHHTPGSLTLGKPGPVLVDWGAVASGYRSDSTRTWWWGSAPPSSFRKHLEAVMEAQSEAMDMVAPGVEAWEIDNASRRVLSKYGLSKYFIHGLGHGVGIDIHEAPYLRPGSKTILEPGMVITIEPGIYMSGLYGIRIEDMIVVTKRGYRRLTRLAREIPFAP